tara:strand:+ start:616 stop:978 length:363 start_codon:yes stop_codon:yes gene_type:complete
MSDTGILQQFNINELAGATGLILGALGGILAIIFKSRCYCRLNLCYLCFCERKPPPDTVVDSDEEDNKKPKEKDKRSSSETKLIDKPKPKPKATPKVTKAKKSNIEAVQTEVEEEETIIP